MDRDEIPLGLGMALAQQPDAMASFGALSREQRAQFIHRAHNAETKEEMQELVSELLH